VARYSLCARNEEKYEMHVFVICEEPQRRREEFLNNTWLYVTEDTADKKIITCKMITELNLGKFL
jgi:hypothetical protein